jgi:hypothetical protein
MSEKCYYCENEAKYNDLVKDGEDFVVTGVCGYHTKNYYSG